MSFNEVTAAAQAYAEQSDLMGETFTYTPRSGTPSTSFVGVFNQVELDFEFSDAGMRKITALVCVTSKPQWATASITPQDRATITYGGVAYPIQAIAGLDSAGEPAYSFTLFKQT